MWLLFGIVAITTAFCNWLWAVRGKKPEVFRFISLSATALTVCGFYQQNTDWVRKEDWGALMDCAGISTALWVLVAVSVFVNGATMLFKKV